jgi:NitT/TauT family transport system substrate-binding protein
VSNGGSDSISVLDPAMKQAKLDLGRTFDNALVEKALKKYGQIAKK